MRDQPRSHALRAWWRSPVEVACSAVAALGALMGGLLVVTSVWPRANGYAWTAYLLLGGAVLIAALVAIERARVAAADRRDAVAWRALAAQLGRGRPVSTRGNGVDDER
jgi:hypothetical protein